MTQLALQLAPHVALADARGDLILLDLSAGAYLCVPREEAGPLRRALAGRPRAGDEPAVADLVARGLAAWATDPAPRAALAVPCRRLEPIDSGPVGARDLGRLALAAVVAAWRYRRGRWSSPTIGPDAFDPRAVAALVGRFERLRLFLPFTGRCLPHSMLLRAFLDRYGVATRLVFGARTRPFEAHCWVEWHGQLLNDSLEHMRWYTPVHVT